MNSPSSTLESTRQASAHQRLQAIDVPQTLLIAGVQGSGKGTQAKRLSKRFGYTTHEMGKILREEEADTVVQMPRMKIALGTVQKKGGPLLQEAMARKLASDGINLAEVNDAWPVVLEDFPITVREIMAVGDKVPTPDMMRIVEARMTHRNTMQRLLWDGMPRTMDQYDAFNDVLRNAGRSGDVGMVYINVSEKTALQNVAYRAASDENAREDDADEATVRRRINGFNKDTKDVIAQYSCNRALYYVNGETGIDLSEATELQLRAKPLRSKKKNTSWGFTAMEEKELEEIEFALEDIQRAIDESINEVERRVLGALRRG